MVSRLLTSPFMRGFLGALAAVGIGAFVLLLIHLWSDHAALHVVIDYLNRNAEKINQLPMVTPSQP